MKQALTAIGAVEDGGMSGKDFIFDDLAVNDLVVVQAGRYLIDLPDAQARGEDQEGNHREEILETHRANYTPPTKKAARH